MNYNLKVFSNLGIDIEYILLGSVIIIALLLLLVIILFIKQAKLNKKYNRFMDGEDGASLENVIKKRIDQISILEKKEEENEKNIAKVEDILKLMFGKYGIVKYDAFKEMGGKLSFALAILNSNRDGFIINAMHSNREGCFTYLKAITNGEAAVMLSESEKEALEIALKS